MSEETNAEETVYSIRLSAPATLQVAAAFDFMNDTAGIEAAEDWQAGLRTTYATLATLPERFPVADENRIYQKKHPGPPLRVALYRHGRSVWRLLLTVQEATADDPPSVVIRQLRHGAQKPLKNWPD